MNDKVFKQWQINTARKRMEMIKDMIRRWADMKEILGIRMEEILDWVGEYMKLATFLRRCN